MTEDYLVLLHGLGRTGLSMKYAEKRLAAEGFRTVNIGYPSRTHPIEKLAEKLGAALQKRCPDRKRKIHFITHSMGGIVLRCFLTGRTIENLGRVVMLSPPNRGSQLAQRLVRNPLYKVATGPSGQQLGTAPESVPLSLGPVTFELGVITGDRAANPLSYWIEGRSDGKVAVDEARAEGMSDFLVVPRGHTFIMNDAEVLKQAVHFIRHGSFAKVAG